VSVPLEWLYVSKIVVALNDLPESQLALRIAIELARASNAELATVSILGDLPSYSSFTIVVDPTAPNAMMEDWRRAQGELHQKASLLAQEFGSTPRSMSPRLGTKWGPH
jgi:nucleotide-binding universal stress UspA family protein